MNILITGSSGFIGKNVFHNIKARNKDFNIYTFEKNDTLDTLEELIRKSDIIIHLAGVNRPIDTNDFAKENFELTKYLCQTIIKYKLKTRIIFSSSIQAEFDNPYGISKKKAEDELINLSSTNGNPVKIFRFKNLFGKWCKPNYNSVVATFCYSIVNGKPITISDENKEITFQYIDDVVDAIYEAMQSEDKNIFTSVKKEYTVTLGYLAKMLQTFKNDRESLFISNQKDEFLKKLYATFISYYDTDNFSYHLKMNEDNRGSFTELIKTEDRGQVSVNICKPGIIKGNHWHNTKNEKFIVVKGQAEIKFRKIGTSEIINYKVDSDKMEVVDIPPGYTHSIQNTGNEDCIIVMWANETFNPNIPDTFFEEVEI